MTINDTKGSSRDPSPYTSTAPETLLECHRKMMDLPGTHSTCTWPVTTDAGLTVFDLLPDLPTHKASWSARVLGTLERVGLPTPRIEILAMHYAT